MLLGKITAYKVYKLAVKIGTLKEIFLPGKRWVV